MREKHLVTDGAADPTLLGGLDLAMALDVLLPREPGHGRVHGEVVSATTRHTSPHRSQASAEEGRQGETRACGTSLGDERRASETE